VWGSRALTSTSALASNNAAALTYPDRTRAMTSSSSAHAPPVAEELLDSMLGVNACDAPTMAHMSGDARGALEPESEPHPDASHPLSNKYPNASANPNFDAMHTAFNPPMSSHAFTPRASPSSSSSSARIVFDSRRATTTNARAHASNARSDDLARRIARTTPSHVATGMAVSMFTIVSSPPARAPASSSSSASNIARSNQAFHSNCPRDRPRDCVDDDDDDDDDDDAHRCLVTRLDADATHDDDDADATDMARRTLWLRHSFARGDAIVMSTWYAAEALANDVDALDVTSGDDDAATAAASSTSILPSGGPPASLRFTTKDEAEHVVARTRATEKACATSIANMQNVMEDLRRKVEDWAEDTRLRVRALSNNQQSFHDGVEKLRATLERELAKARSMRVGGAEAAKSATQKCLRGCEALRANALPMLREVSESLTSERAQLSRNFLAAWQSVEDEFHERFNALVDFDTEITQRATLVDPTSLLALVEDASTCAGARTPELARAIDAFAMECLVPKRLSILPKAREGARASDVAKPMPTLVATPPPKTTPKTPTPTPKTPPPKTSTPVVDAARAREAVARELQSFLSGALAARDIDAHELESLVDEFLAFSSHSS